MDNRQTILTMNTANCDTKLEQRNSDGEDVPAALFQVILTMKQPNKRETVSICFCLAPSPEGAIAQVSDEACGPDAGCLAGYEAMKAGRLTATATKIPLHIRGWGVQTF